MGDLFTRTVSQALQASLPAAAALAAYRRDGHRDAVRGVTWGVAAALVGSAPAGWLFQRSTHQSTWEVALALLSIGGVVWLLRHACRRSPVAAVPVAAITALLVTRQSMEIAAVSMAALQLRSFDPLTAIAGATALAMVAAIAWAWAVGRLAASTASVATRLFLGLFLAQLGMYAFHEAAEARLLPWSEPIHAATEPYGPDGLYGRQFSWLLVAVPFAGALVAAAWRKRQPAAGSLRVRSAGFAFGACLVIVALAGGLSLRSAGTVSPVPADQTAAMAAAPHVLFRHTLPDDDYGKLAMAPLASPSARRLSLGMPCERVAFARGRGLCLQAQRGVFTTYRAILFDSGFDSVASWEIAGSPSRTRVAPDGRVGAITVFVTGHGYGASPFSTKTTLVDMESGDTIGELEQFSTWRGKTRIKAQDFNFWGVTFSASSNVFYATLGTAGKTYLVKGDLGLRRFTVLYEGVECPSLSPDGRLIAFKKRSGPAAGNWRLAVLDLTTMTERLIAGESRNLDDQVEWLDNQQVLYAVQREGSAITEVWVAPAMTDGPARVLITGAESPAVVGAYLPKTSTTTRLN